MNDEEELLVIDRNGWRIVHKGKSFGPFGSERAALEVAVTWAINGVRQGHGVDVLVKDADGGIRVEWSCAQYRCTLAGAAA